MQYLLCDRHWVVWWVFSSSLYHSLLDIRLFVGSSLWSTWYQMEHEKLLKRNYRKTRIYLWVVEREDICGVPAYIAFLHITYIYHNINTAKWSGQAEYYNHTQFRDVQVQLVYTKKTDHFAGRKHACSYMNDVRCNIAVNRLNYVTIFNAL
jgi:hypothetical protein